MSAPPRQSPFRRASLMEAAKDAKVACSLKSIHNVAERLTPNVDAKMVEQGLTCTQLQFSSLGKLYGRDEEICILIEALERTVNNHQKQRSPTEVVMISGVSGTGKSALALELEGVCRNSHKGCFCSGKFDLQDRGFPYSAISAALANLVEEITLRTSKADQDLLEELQSKLAAVMGREGDHVLRAVIPNLHVLQSNTEESSERQGETTTTKDTSNNTTVGSAEEKAKFLFLLRKVMEVICKACCPVVLFLDDLQWVDAASLDLLRALATDGDISGLLVLGCYRDNEIDVGHRLSVFLNHLEAPGADGRAEQVRLTSVTVGNLDPGTIHNMLDDLLQASDPSNTVTLAQILHTKTFGNIFFVIQFLKTLRKMGLLKFNLAQFEWRWNDEEIAGTMDVTDNVAELMRLEIENHLSLPAQKCLQIAACLGNEFEESTLVLIITKMSEDEGPTKDGFVASAYTADEEQVKHWLEQCVECGFLSRQPTARVISYRFLHDVIQEAALSLIDDEDLAQFRIGKVLIKNLPRYMLESNLFVIVDVLNHGAKLKSLDESRPLLVSLNLRAGKKALKSSAFEAAAEYLAFSVRLLGHDCWDDRNYALSLEIFSTAAQAEFCNANLERCKGYIDQVLAQTERPIEDKLPAFLILIDWYNFQEQHSEALSTNLTVLKQVGVHFGSAKALPLATLSSFLKTKSLLRNMGANDLLRLPPMKDKIKVMAMKFLDRALNACYMLNSPYFPVIEFKMVRWSLKHGVCPQSAVAFVVYGLLLAGSVGDLRRARVMGEVADKLSSRPSLKETRSRILMQTNGYVFHWTSPLRTCMKPLLLGYEVGMREGDLENAFFNAYMYAQCTICAGRALDLIHADMLEFTAQMKIYSQETIYQMCLPHWQFVLNMMDDAAPNPPILSGEIMDYEEGMKHLIETNHVYMQDVTRLNQLQLAFYFGDYELAWKMVEASKDFEKTNISHVTVIRRVFFVGMTAFCLARSTTNRIRCLAWKRRGKAAHEKLKKWLVGGNVNCAHLLRLLEAERQSLGGCRGTQETVLPLFQKAIAMSSRAGLIHDAALASERTAEYLSGLVSFVSGPSRGRVWDYIEMAITYYTEWGATAKVDQLNQKWSAWTRSKRSTSLVLDETAY